MLNGNRNIKQHHGTNKSRHRAVIGDQHLLIAVELYIIADNWLANCVDCDVWMYLLNLFLTTRYTSYLSTFFLGRLLFFAFFTPYVSFFVEWDFFFNFEPLTCVFPGAMFFSGRYFMCWTFIVSKTADHNYCLLSRLLIIRDLSPSPPPTALAHWFSGHLRLSSWNV